MGVETGTEVMYRRTQRTQCMGHNVLRIRYNVLTCRRQKCPQYVLFISPLSLPTRVQAMEPCYNFPVKNPYFTASTISSSRARESRDSPPRSREPPRAKTDVSYGCDAPAPERDINCSQTHRGRHGGTLALIDISRVHLTLPSAPPVRV